MLIIYDLDLIKTSIWPFSFRSRLQKESAFFSQNVKTSACTKCDVNSVALTFEAKRRFRQDHCRAD